MFAARNVFLTGSAKPRDANVTYVSSAGSSMATHVAGDLIIGIGTYVGTTTPTLPASGGTVPVWTEIATAKPSASYGFYIAWAVATANNHTFGTWANTFQRSSIVFRNSGSAPIGAYSYTGGQNSVIDFPAITLNNTSGSSQVFQYAFHGNASAFNSAVPQDAGYTTRVALGSNYFSTKDSTTTDGLNYTNASAIAYFYTIQMEIKW